MPRAEVETLTTENRELGICLLERAVSRSRADHMVAVILKSIFIRGVS
jgi:hypothetical protein